MDMSLMLLEQVALSNVNLCDLYQCNSVLICSKIMNINRVTWVALRQ